MGSDPYMGSGYKSERARDEGRAFNRPQYEDWTPRAFVAPGFPAEAPIKAPPPPVPPAAVGAAGAAAGGALAIPVGIAAGVGLGLGLGLWVKRDIDRFKRDAKLPFYDDLKWQPAKNEVGYDAEWDEAYREWIRRQVENFPWPKDRPAVFVEVPMPADFYAPDGRHGPVVTFADGAPQPQRSYWAYVDTCPGNPDATRWASAELSPLNACNSEAHWHTLTLFDSGGGSACGATTYTQGYIGSISTANFRCPSEPLPGRSRASRVGGWSVNGLGLALARECWVINTSAAATSPIKRPQLGYGTTRLKGPVPIEEPLLGFGRPWKDAVAPVGTQPSLAQQSRSGRLPRGSTRKGFYVPFRFDAPVTVVTTAPGSPPVTVPDVVIGPSPSPSPGGGGTVPPITVTPPTHPPQEEKPGRGKEKKLNIRSGYAGVAFLALNFATEAHDAIEAFWRTIPARFRTKARRGAKVSHMDMLSDLYDFFGEVDWARGVENFINNQIEDYAYGQVGRVAGKASRGVGVTTGLGRAVKGRNDTSMTLPEVHFADGVYGVSWGDYEIRL